MPRTNALLPRPLPTLVTLILLTLPTGCKPPAASVVASDSSAAVAGEKARILPLASASPSPVAVTVNGQAISEAEVKGAAESLAVPYPEALKLTVQAEVVAQEARRAAFPGADGTSDRFALAQDFLATVYSAKTLCGAINSTTVEQFYEHRYQPEWPADVYQGDLVELRCCQRLELDQCDPHMVAECMARNRDLMRLLLPVATQWATEDLPSLGDLQKTHPGLVVTDFGVIDWPGIPKDRKRPRELFPESVVDAIKVTPVGGVVGPIQSAIGYHLLKLAKRRGAIKADSPEFVSAARQTICNDRIQQTRWDYVEQLVKSAVVTQP